ncbi:MAG: ThuA domain-containing protein [Planctomycetota bacterium]|nr:ThuA domain-containing protein [Planctomycetota bacterium]
MMTTAILVTAALASIMTLTSPPSSATPPAPADARWLTYPGDPNQEPGQGRRIVFVAGDEEYRSEEALPMLARLMNQHGFECIVLFSQDDESGEVDPETLDHIPGLHLIDDADVLVLFLRFRELPDEDMAHIVKHVQAGKPVTGFRTATHAFFYRENPESPHARWTWNAEDPPGGFGGEIMGETWVSHHGHHGSQATRGVIESDNASHPVLRGVDDVFGPTDVYGIRSLPDDSTILLRGAVLKGMSPGDKPVEGKQNDPMIPLAWVRERTMPDGSTQRIFATTMGTAEDWSSEDLRRIYANATLWQLEDEEMIPPGGLDAPLVGPWEPTPFGFGSHKRGYKPADYRDGSPWAKTSGENPNKPADTPE